MQNLESQPYLFPSPNTGLSSAAPKDVSKNRELLWIKGYSSNNTSDINCYEIKKTNDGVTLKCNRLTEEMRTKIRNYYQSHLIQSEKLPVDCRVKIANTGRLIRNLAPAYTQSIECTGTLEQIPETYMHAALTLGKLVEKILMSEVKKSKNTFIIEEGKCIENLDSAYRHVVHIFEDIFYHYLKENSLDKALETVKQFLYTTQGVKALLVLALKYSKQNPHGDQVDICLLLLKKKVIRHQETAPIFETLLKTADLKEIFSLIKRIPDEYIKKHLIDGLCKAKIPDTKILPILLAVNELNEPRLTPAFYKKLIGMHLKKNDIPSAKALALLLEDEEDRIGCLRQILDKYLENDNIREAINIGDHIQGESAKRIAYYSIAIDCLEKQKLDDAKEIALVQLNTDFNESYLQTDILKKIIIRHMNANNIPKTLKAISFLKNHSDRQSMYQKGAELQKVRGKIEESILYISHMDPVLRNREYINVIDYCLDSGKREKAELAVNLILDEQDRKHQRKRILN